MPKTAHRTIAPDRKKEAARPGGAVRPGRPSVEFGQRLRALRHARGMRQEDLAGEEYSPTYISMLESGRTRASMKALEYLAARLGVSVSELLGGAPPAAHADAALALARALAAGGEAERALEVLAGIRSEPLSPQQLLARLRVEGGALIELRRAKDALAPLERALTLAQQLGDPAQVARVRKQLGMACYYTFAYREAVQHHLAALEACQRGEIRDAQFELRVLSNLGNDHAVLREHDAAIGYYERALAIAQDVVDQERLAGVHSGLAYAYTMQHDFEAAIRHAQESLTLYEQLGAKRVLPEVMNNLAVLYGKVGNVSRADELLQRAIERASATESRIARPHLLLSRAELYRERDPRLARELAQQARDVAVATEHREGLLSARLFLAALETEVEAGRAAFEDCLNLAEAELPGRAKQVLETWSEWEERHGDARRAAQLARRALRES